VEHVFNPKGETMSKIKILVGIPMLTPGYEFFKALMKFQADVIRDGKYEIGFTTAYRQPTFLAQEEFAQLAIATESDYLLVMDDDIWNPSLLYLDRLVQAEKEVVGGVFFSSADPGNLCAKRLMDKHKSMIDLVTTERDNVFAMYSVPTNEWEGIQKVHLISLGFVLIKTKVFSKLKKPWFSCDMQKRFTDSVFCENCKKAKVDVFAHFGCWLNHRGITYDTFPHWAEIYKKQKDSTWKPSVPMTEKDYVKHINVTKNMIRKAQKQFTRTKAEGIEFFG